eukprot:445931-Prorocentrum_minimum.AAC.1
MGSDSVPASQPAAASVGCAAEGGAGRGPGECQAGHVLRQGVRQQVQPFLRLARERRRQQGARARDGAGHITTNTEQTRSSEREKEKAEAAKTELIDLRVNGHTEWVDRFVETVLEPMYSTLLPEKNDLLKPLLSN